MEGPVTHTVAELVFAEAVATTDMTLIPNASTLASEPNDAAIYILKQNVDAQTDGTDFEVFASIDNGTTFTEAATYTTVGAFGANDTLVRCDVDVSAQTGTSFKWKITTTNTKGVRVKQVTAFCS
jgi:hypothetical protein